MYRLGFTESTLLFFYYLDNYISDINKNEYIYLQYNKIQWLYTTSGFYDKTININDYFQIINSKVYNDYFTQLLNAVKNYSGKVTFYFDDCVNMFDKQKVSFFNFIQKDDNKNTPRNDINYISREFIYESIANQNVVIINNFGKLMVQQVLNGNLKNIYSDLPIIKNIDFIQPFYTFLNDGPHQSILESVEYIYKNIDCKIENTDIFIISAGAYSLLIANYIYINYKKKVIVVGGDLSSFFGINTKRGQMFYKDVHELHKQYFIDVPEEMKPPNYMQIENGCYW